jgi:hypothetical protein
MNKHSHTTNGRTYQVRSFSLRPDQVAWLQAEAERLRHGNVSRVLQELIDACRETDKKRKNGAANELESVA